MDNELIIIDNKKEIKFEFLKYLLFLIGFLVLNNSSLFGIIKPFSPAFLFALVWCNQNVFLLSFVYLLSSVFFGFNSQNLLPSIFAIGVLICIALIHKKTKKKPTLTLSLFYFLLSQIGKFFILDSKLGYLISISEILIGIITYICFATFFQAIIQRKMKIKLNVDEKVCGGVFLVAIACGLTNLVLKNILIGYCIALMFSLVFLNIFGFSKGLVFSALIGVGFFLNSQNVNFLTGLIIINLIAGIFVGNNKYLVAVCALMIEAVLGFYFEIFNDYTIINYLINAFAILISCLISNSTYKTLKKVFLEKESENTDRFLLNITRKIQFQKLSEISKVFAEMDDAYKLMLKKTLSKDEACFVLAQELQERICNDCLNCKVCFRKSGQDMLSDFYNMFHIGLAKKQLGIVDLPMSLKTKCDKQNVILNCANIILNQYLQYSDMITGINTSRLLISDQMRSVSKAVNDLAQDCKKSINFDHELESKILQNLVYNNLTNITNICVVKSDNSISVVVSALKELEDKKQLETIVEKCCRLKMEIKSISTDEQSKVLNYLLVNKPKCDLVFGTASANKSVANVSGDSHVLSKISTGKFLIGVCDGIGTGKNAGELSNQTINLIENYYKAGFETNSILSNVNNLFMIGNEEKFSALDVCVLDLNSLQADFIKLGAPKTYIKKKDRIEIVDGGALPIGVVENVKPNFEKKLIEPKDIIYMVSDGVSDCFENEDELKTEISLASGTNPQELAQNLLDKAINRNKGAINDDMTVLVSRVFSKV